MKLPILILITAALLFGCVADSKPQITPTGNFQQTKQTENGVVSPPAKTEFSLPLLKDGKACVYRVSRQEMECNFKASGFTAQTGFNISSNQPFAMAKCKTLTILIDETRYEMISLFPYQDEIIKIDNGTTNNALSRSLVNPCLMQTAIENGKINRDYCFYNSTTKNVFCGRNITFLHRGIFYNFTGSPLKLDACGLTAISDEKANETYFAYIWKNKDMLIKLGENESKSAVGTLVAGGDCDS